MAVAVKEQPLSIAVEMGYSLAIPSAVISLAAAFTIAGGRDGVVNRVFMRGAKRCGNGGLSEQSGVTRLTV